MIDFTVAGGMGGNSTVEATGSPSAPDPATNLFTYRLTIVGATGESARSTAELTSTPAAPESQRLSVFCP